MIAIGGVIGAGLFVGSGVVMSDTGPGVFLTYALSGVLIIMVMRMLAEMAVARPVDRIVRRLLPRCAGPVGGLLGRLALLVLLGDRRRLRGDRGREDRAVLDRRPTVVVAR